MSRALTCAIICFCVSRGRSSRCNLPSGLSATTDLPLERLLGPGVSDLEALIVGGGDGNWEMVVGLAQEGGKDVRWCRGRPARYKCVS